MILFYGIQLNESSKFLTVSVTNFAYEANGIKKIIWFVIKYSLEVIKLTGVCQISTMSQMEYEDLFGIFGRFE